MAAPRSPRVGPVLFAALLAFTAAGCGERGPRPRNVVLIVVDTLRADHLSLYGYPRDTTPELARVARGGAVFERAFTVISHTLPAHVSLLTGLHPTGHKVLSNGWRYLGRFPTLAERLRGAGYRTAGFVSGVPLQAESGMARGFDVYRDTRDRFGIRRAKVPGTEVTRRALRWLADGASLEPFFLFLHYYDAHPPYLRAPGAAFPFEIDATLERIAAERGVADLSMREISHAPITLGERELDLLESINTYDNEIHHVDAMVAEVLEALAARGALERTLLVLTSDHGEGLGEHGYFQHGLHLYEEQLHIPLLLRDYHETWPARRVSEPVSLLDVAATVLDAAGLPADPELHGTSLLPLARGAAPRGERRVLAQRRFFSKQLVRARGRFATREPLYAVRGGGPWKLLVSGSGEVELYDLAADPHELRDRSGSHEEERDRLLAAVAELRRRYATDAAAPGTGVDEQTAEMLEALGYLP